MGKKMQLTINTDIKVLLQNNNIPLQDGVAYLLCLYYSLDPSFIPDILKTKVLSIGIVSKDYESGILIWKEDLFEESIGNFEWIEDWMQLFKNKNPARRGNKREVLKRMKKFFTNNPQATPDSVLIATKQYLNGTQGSYIRMSQRFIYEQDGSSMLESYLEALNKKKKNISGYSEDII